MTGWKRLGIGGLSQGYLSGRLNPSAVLDDALAGIAAVDDDLSAFVAIDADGARRAAAAADAELKRGRWRGHLHGVPIAVKELFDVRLAEGPPAWQQRFPCIYPLIPAQGHSGARGAGHLHPRR